MERLISYLKVHDLIPFVLMGSAGKMNQKWNWQRIAEAIIIAIIIAGTQAYFTLAVTNERVNGLSKEINKVDSRIQRVENILMKHSDNY